MDSDSMDYFKYEKESSVERCAGIAPQLLQKRPEALCSRPYKKISQIIKQKNYVWGFTYRLKAPKPLTTTHFLQL